MRRYTDRVTALRECSPQVADVTLLAANVQVPVPDGVDVVEAGSAAELRREALARADADVVVMAAAVADYRPAEKIDGKRPKDGEPWLVELVPTGDIVKALAAGRRPGQVLVAFGAEQGEAGLERKRAMLHASRLRRNRKNFTRIGRRKRGSMRSPR